MPRQIPENIPGVVGANLAYYRAKKGWTQEHVAEKIGRAKRYVQRCEAGQNMQIVTVARFAHVLGIPVFRLFQPWNKLPKRRPGRPRKQVWATVERWPQRS